MHRIVQPIGTPLRVAGYFAIFALLLQPNFARVLRKEKKQQTTLRWIEGQPGCTFSRGDDGKYRYSLWTPDYGVILAVDSQELEKVHRRVESFFSVELTVHYRGQSTLDVAPGEAKLEFVRHFNVVQPSLGPESFAQKTQNDADERDHQAQREIGKHPERKEEREKVLQTYQKEVDEFLDFLTKRAMRGVTLGPANPEVKGWVLFSVDSKWIGGWKKPEEFILRLPLAGRVLEFPFSLPATQGDLILRKRPY
jgi:hypothetical protein